MQGWSLGLKCAALDGVAIVARAVGVAVAARACVGGQAGSLPGKRARRFQIAMLGGRQPEGQQQQSEEGAQTVVQGAPTHGEGGGAVKTGRIGNPAQVRGLAAGMAVEMKLRGGRSRIDVEA